MLSTIDLQTEKGDSLIDITAQVRAAVESAGVAEGICVLFVPHTTAAITINSALDPMTAVDIVADLRRIVPTRVDFAHQYDTPADAAGHIKAALVGHSVTLILNKGKLLLGGSQSILFYEFDGPRKRQVQIKVIQG
ncbi:MAG: secondary thiamine-phosphate synthase enzyme YjbQ [Anaerolineae bacterium]|nr:secondary thiamine-phosphate synthase enzyme YjbQ [Anaerolineae bacterium]